MVKRFTVLPIKLYMNIVKYSATGIEEYNTFATSKTSLTNEKLK
jgi:hypothetical protein